MQLEGKIIDFMGDSITEGVGVADIENGRYDNVLKRLGGLKAVYNYGISGSRLAHQQKPSECARFDLCFCGRAYDLNQDADIIMVYGGVNDYLHGDAPFGQYGDNTPATFCGAVEWLMQFLETTYQDKTIVFLTPAHCCDDMQPSQNPNKRPDAKPLKDYVDVIEETAKKHSVHVFNMYEKLGLNPNQPEITAEYAPDGLHFNDKGHAVIAGKVLAFLKEL